MSIALTKIFSVDVYIILVYAKLYGGDIVGMKYYKLFDLLARKGMKKTDLIRNKIISSPTLAKLSKGETVTTEILGNICEALNCQPGDIMEYITDKENPLQDASPSPQPVK